MLWKGATDDSLTVKLAYEIENNFPAIDTSNSDIPGWSKLLFACVALKIKLFWWKAVHNILPIVVKLKEKTWSISEVCLTCGVE